MIPRIIYAAWCGSKPMPTVDCYFDTWAAKLPGYKIVLLGDKDIPASPCTKAMRKRGKIVNAAQYACWARMLKTGGIYLDLDVDIVRPFDDLLDRHAFLGIENDGPGSIWAACGVIGAEKGSPFIREALAYMDRFDYTHPKVENELGPRMWTKLLVGKGWKRKDADAVIGGVQLLKSARFYPYSWQETYKPSCVTPDTYAVHRWAHTWNPALDEPVSIIIPCYNQAEFLPDAIESALAQTVAPHEVIVVDDGSARSLKPIVDRYPGVKFIRQANAGVAAARNTGIRAATGDWICCLDSDDKLAPTFISRLIGRTDVVSCLLKTFGDGKKPQTWCGVKYPTVRELTQANQLICGSLYRRSWWQRVGGYDEAMRDGYEDWDFWTRVAAAGAGMTNYDEVLFHYRKHATDRRDVLGSIEHAATKHDEIVAYMRAKWERLGIIRPRRPRVTGTFTLGKTVEHKGVTYPTGMRVDAELLYEFGAAGLINDARFRR